MKSIVSFLNIDIVDFVNLAFVRYFLAVVETSSFTAAAERCRLARKIEPAMGSYRPSEPYCLRRRSPR
jgi:hypothetical protein